MTDLTEIVLINLFAIACLVVLLLGSVLQKSVRDESVRNFSGLVLTTMGFQVVNLAGELLEGHPEYAGFSFFVNLLGFFAVDFVVLSFCVYLRSLLGEPSRKQNWQLNTVAIAEYLRMGLIAVLAVTKQLFTIDANGNYQELSLCFIPYVYSAAVMLLLVGVVIVNRRCFTKRQFVVVILYEVLPVLPIVIEMYTDIYSLSGMALTLSILMIYVLIQAVAIEKIKLRESLLEELNSTDFLTGIGNRRSYYQRLDEIKDRQTVGILFCDLNGLKYANDHFGHAAGDALLKRFGCIVTEAFGRRDAFRISGDEFVVLISDVGFESFLRRSEAFKSTLRHEGSIAAVGYAFGTGCCVDRLISEAESLMYEDKKINGKERGQKNE